ncbi:hypothetical protein Taro_029048, partial [Colocasia esculenta]|nr:hypothetical protein [Colocasia esculenta]
DPSSASDNRHLPYTSVRPDPLRPNKEKVSRRGSCGFSRQDANAMAKFLLPVLTYDPVAEGVHDQRHVLLVGAAAVLWLPTSPPTLLYLVVLYIMSHSTADTVGMYAVRFLASNHISPISCQSRPSMLPTRSPAPPRPLAPTREAGSAGQTRCLGHRLLLFSLPFQGHINHMFQLATLLFQRGFSVTVIHTLFNAPNPSGHPHFRFVAIDDGLPVEVLNSHDILAKAIAITKAHRVPFHDCLVRLLEEAAQEGEDPVACLLADAMLYSIAGVAEELDVRRVVVHTSSAAYLRMFSLFPTLWGKGYYPIQSRSSPPPPLLLSFSVLFLLGYFHQEDHCQFRWWDLNAVPVAINIIDMTTQSNTKQRREEEAPEAPPYRVKDLMNFDHSNDTSLLKIITNAMELIRGSAALVLNTFKDLEATDLDVLRRAHPSPVFTVGPLRKFSQNASNSLLEQDRSCMAWLDRKK